MLLLLLHVLQDDRLLPRRTPPPAEARGALATAAFPSLQQALDGGQGPDGHAMVVLAALRQLQQGATQLAAGVEGLRQLT